VTTFVGARGAGSLTEATGWELKPEGMCRDDACVPVSSSDAAEIWSTLQWPLVRAGDEVYLGEPLAHRATATAGSMAPDFTLQDIHGVSHSLSEHRGKKVLLASWAPW
jgi:hypothetical protein